VQAVITTTDAVASVASERTRQSMHAAFTRATQLEWMFWDSAYRLAKWPV
jgi:thiaminase/transcriptional activator TenA